MVEIFCTEFGISIALIFVDQNACFPIVFSVFGNLTIYILIISFSASSAIPTIVVSLIFSGIIKRIKES